MESNKEITLYKRIIHWQNLLEAYTKACYGKRRRCTAADFEYHLEDNLVMLHKELAQKSYCPGQYSSFYIHDPKKRLISAAPFRDRVVHHALCNIIEPIFEKSFIFDSYANRIRKGTHRAIDRAQYFSRRFKYVLPCDIRQYFPAIDHEILREILFRKIKDSNTRWLMDKILTSGIGVLKEVYDMTYFPGDDLFAINRPRGLPIGNLTSQFWANCYLNPFDHFVKRELRCKGYVRYVDDMLFFANDKKTLWNYKESVIHRLSCLRLKIHTKSAAVKPVREGTLFLGFIIYPNKRRLKRRKGIHFRRKIYSLFKAYEDDLIPYKDLSTSMKGWMNHVRYGDTKGLQFAVLFPIIHKLIYGVDHAQDTPFHKNV